MGTRRTVGGIIVALISLIAMALFITTLFIPHINARIQQVSSSVILEPYGADLKFYLTKGTATNDYGEEVWVEDPYGSDIGSALVFSRCPDALDDLRLVRRLVVACAILCGAAAAMAFLSVCCCGRMARWGTLPMLFSLLTALAAVGLMAWVAVLFFSVYEDHRDCLSSFGADGNFTGFTFSSVNRKVINRNFRNADVEGFIASDSNNTGAEQYYYLRSSNNVEYFESILTPDYQTVYTNLTEDQQFQFRRAVAVGAVGQIRVNDVRLSQGPRVLIAAWAIALIAALVAIFFLCMYCCCHNDAHSSRRRLNKNRPSDHSEMITRTTVTTTDFPPQLYNATTGPNATVDHDFHNPTVLHEPQNHVHETSPQAVNPIPPRSPDYVDTRHAAFAEGSTTEEAIGDQPYSYDENNIRRQQGRAAMPEERVYRGQNTYYQHQQNLNYHSQQPVAVQVPPNHQRQEAETHPSLLNIQRQPTAWRPLSTSTPIGCLSISSPTSHGAGGDGTAASPFTNDRTQSNNVPVGQRSQSQGNNTPGVNMYEHNLKVWKQFQQKEQQGRRSRSSSPNAMRVSPR